MFVTNARKDYLLWQDADPKILKRLDALIKECTRTPFQGPGKPEPLKGDLKGWWSRRITHEDRLVYRVDGDGLVRSLRIAQCRFHY